MNYFGTPLIDGRLHKRLRDKNYNVSNDKQHYNDQWTRLTSEWQISDNLSASNELYYLKAQRRWQNAEYYNWNTTDRQLSRSGYFGIGHQQEQVGDRQTFTLKHSLFGLDSQTLVGMDYNRIRFHMKSNSPFNDVTPMVTPSTCTTRPRASSLATAPTAISSRPPPGRCRSSPKTACNSASAGPW